MANNVRLYPYDEIVTFVGEYQKDRGYGPTIREIQDKFTVSSTSVVSYIVDQLIKEGKLTADYHNSQRLARTLRVKWPDAQ